MAQAEYQYGTSPRKIQPDYDRKVNKKSKLRIVENNKRQQLKITKEQKKKNIRITFMIIVAFLLLMTISCRNSIIDKQFNQIQNQKKDLSVIQKENEQLKVSIENSLNLSNIEKIAKEELGMQKLSSKQTVYVALPKKDYIETATEKVVVEEKNWFQQFIDNILNF